MSHGSLQLPHEGSRGARTDLCSLVTSDRTQDDGLKLQQGRVRPGVRKTLFTQRVVRPETGSPGQ